MTAPTDPQIAAVVEGLSEAQREMVLAGTGVFSFRNEDILRLLELGIWGTQPGPIYHAVRAHLERQDDER